VHHLGVVVDKLTGNLIYYNYLILVDTFAKSLQDLSPSVNAIPQVTSTEMIGQVLGTRLRVSYSVQCTGGLIGPNCDLTCNRTANNVAICWRYSTVSGTVWFVCQYTDSSYSQVGNCVDCPAGINNNTCASGLYVQGINDQGKVSSAYRVWTIVLGCLLGLAIIFIIFLILFYCITRNKQQPPSYRTNDVSGGFRASTNGTRPLLKDHEWRPHQTPAALHRPPDHDTSRASDESSFQQRNGNASIAQQQQQRREAQV